MVFGMIRYLRSSSALTVSGDRETFHILFAIPGNARLQRSRKNNTRTQKVVNFRHIDREKSIFRDTQTQTQNMSFALTNIQKHYAKSLHIPETKTVQKTDTGKPTNKKTWKYTTEKSIGIGWHTKGSHTKSTHSLFLKERTKRQRNSNVDPHTKHPGYQSRK